MSVQNPYDDSVIKGSGWSTETLKAIKEYVDLIDDAASGLVAIKAEVEGLAGEAMRGTNGAALAADYTAGRAGYLDNLASTAVGRLQVKATTIELNQAAGVKDLFLGTTQDVVIEKLAIRIPVDVSAGASTSISIQTDDTTNQVFISAATGVKANLTAQAQLGWTGVTLLKTGKKIQLTIAGAATGIACLCDVIAEYRAVVAGGTLA